MIDCVCDYTCCCINGSWPGLQMWVEERTCRALTDGTWIFLKARENITHAFDSFVALLFIDPFVCEIIKVNLVLYHMIKICFLSVSPW